MQHTGTLDVQMSIDEVMTTWPATVMVLIRHRMHCIGCPISRFHTVVDAAAEHDVDLEIFRRDLEKAIASPDGE